MCTIIVLKFGGANFLSVRVSWETIFADQGMVFVKGITNVNLEGHNFYGS